MYIYIYGNNRCNVMALPVGERLLQGAVSLRTIERPMADMLSLLTS